jgi:ribonucleoside-diphosphate reductase alpha chain
LEAVGSKQLGKVTDAGLKGEATKSSDPVEQAQVVVSSTPNLMAPPKAQRHRLQDERTALTHKFSFGGHEGYITIGLYANGQPGEVFIRMAKKGSTISGLMDSFA